MSTPADEAIYANMLSLQTVSAIQQMHVDGKIDRETYNKLFEAAQKAQRQVQKLVDILEQKRDQQLYSEETKKRRLNQEYLDDIKWRLEIEKDTGEE